MKLVRYTEAGYLIVRDRLLESRAVHCAGAVRCGKSLVESRPVNPVLSVQAVGNTRETSYSSSKVAGKRHNRMRRSRAESDQL